MTERVNIPTHDVDAALRLIVENSISALSVLQRALPECENTMDFLEILDDMNIRGDQLWPIFADFYDYDVPYFVKMVMQRCAYMVDFNNEAAQKAGTSHVAVVRGARAAREKAYALLAQA